LRLRSGHLRIGAASFGLVTASAATTTTISTAATAASATAAATAAEATASAAATAAASATCALRTSFVDVQRSAANFFPIHGVNCAIALRIVRHLDKGKPSGLTRITVGDDIYTVHAAVRFKQRTDVLFGCAETQVSNKNILHLFPFDLSGGAIRVGENTNAPKFAERSNTVLLYHEVHSA
jgi:hypothetical protein